MLAKLWRYITEPVFNAKIDTDGTTGVVIAGQRTKVCTISINLHADRKLGYSQEEIDFPRPSIGEVPGVEVSYGDERRRGREVLEIDVFVRVIKVGTYSIRPIFPENSYNFKIITSRITFHVRPSDATSLELSGIARAPDHGRGDSVYRGGTVEICVEAKDKFGNQYIESDVNFKISPDSSFVTLLSTTRDLQNGSYVVTVSCDKAGKTSFDLLLSQAHHQLVVQVTDLEIIPPPVSASNSCILQSDLAMIQKRIHEAGKVITFKLKLFDIFGNPISFEESNIFIRNIRLNYSGDNRPSRSCAVNRYSTEESDSLWKKEHSLKVRPLVLGSNACELEFTPFIAGNRKLSLFVAGNEVKNSTMEIVALLTFHVRPSDATSLELSGIARAPDHGRGDSVYRGGTVEICVEAKDKFGNQYIESNVNFKISPDSSFVTLLSTSRDLQNGSYVVTVSCDKAGKTSFDILLSQAHHQLVVQVTADLEIIPPPVSASNSYILQSDLDMIQKRIHEAGKVITFKLKLFDIFGNPISFEESNDFPENVHLDYLDDSCPNWSCEVNPPYSTEDNDSIEEEISLKVCPSGLDSNICDLEFTPFIAGNMRFSLNIAEKQIKNSPIKIAVIPGEGGKAQVLYREELLVGQMSLDEVHLIPYRRKNHLEFYEYDSMILCIGVARRQLVGADNANINNINRVLENQYPDSKLSNDIVSRNYGSLVLFDLSGFQKDAALQVFDLLSMLVEGVQHYRNQANEFGNKREIWRVNAIEAFDAGDYREAGRCRAMKEDCGRLMRESNERASDAIFKFYNNGRPQSEIDLHGQHVGNPEKLKDLREQLLSKGDKTTAEVDDIIERQRKERDEAIRKLDERLRTFDHEEAKQSGEDWLEIIDGAGHHSATKGQQKIRPKVKEYLRKKGFKYIEANEGALLITFSEYTGKQPCVADFYCRKCKKAWTSISSWKGYFQRCNKCYYKGTDSKCLPFKLRSVLPPRRQRNDAQPSDFTREDHRRLCEMCAQLGKDCIRLR